MVDDDGGPRARGSGAGVVKVLVPLLRPRGSSTLERLWGRRVLVPLLRARGSLALLKSRATSRSGPADKCSLVSYTAS